MEVVESLPNVSESSGTVLRFVRQFCHVKGLFDLYILTNRALMWHKGVLVEIAQVVFC
jgi:hypothetical protein